MRILTGWLVDFFSKGPFRFLVFLLLGLSVMGFGFFHDAFIKPTHHSFTQTCLMWGVFFVYLLGVLWYVYLIYRKKWKILWDYLKWAQDNSGKH